MPWGWQHVHIIERIDGNRVIDTKARTARLSNVVLLSERDLAAITEKTAPRRPSRELTTGELLAECNNVLACHGKPPRYGLDERAERKGDLLLVRTMVGTMDIWDAHPGSEALRPVVFGVQAASSDGTLSPGDRIYVAGALLAGDFEPMTVEEVAKSKVKVHELDEVFSRSQCFKLIS